MVQGQVLGRAMQPSAGLLTKLRVVSFAPAAFEGVDRDVFSVAAEMVVQGSGGGPCNLLEPLLVDLVEPGCRRSRNSQRCGSRASPPRDIEDRFAFALPTGTTVRVVTL